MVETPCLLDTSTMLWAFASPDRLSAGAKKAIRSRDLILSVVAYWEIVIKSRKGLLQIADPVSWWERATEALAGTILSIRGRHISALSGLPDIHKDPLIECCWLKRPLKDSLSSPAILIFAVILWKRFGEHMLR